MVSTGRDYKAIAAAALRSPTGRVAVKSAAWLLAVPALCALVVLGGAAPIYLLLPEAKPTAVTATEAANPAAPAVAEIPASDTRVAAAPSAEPAPAASASSGPKPYIPPSKDVAGEEPAGDAPPPAEEPVAQAVPTVVPTPRPRVEVAAVETPAAGPRTAAPTAEKPASPAPERNASNAPSASRATPARRFVTIRPVALRSGPGGREVAMLGRGAEVRAGRCEEWCEVESGGVRGWIHPSFLTAAGRNERSERSARRPPVERWEERRPAREQRRVYERESRQDWFVDDDRPIEVYGYDDGR